MIDSVPRPDLRGAILAYSQFMDCLGLDRSHPSVKDTPERVARMFATETCLGLYSSPPDLKAFPNGADEPHPYDGYVIEKDIAFFSLCEHHHAPFFGVMHVAYWPTDVVVGLSKLVRLVTWAAARPQLQERLTAQIADALQRIEGNRGTLVICDARHLCVCGRGAKNPTATTTTSVLRGEIDKDEVLNLIRLRS